MQLKLTLPEVADAFDAAVFLQDGTFVNAGHHEECETLARELSGLYCWVIRGQAIIRSDFEHDEPA